MPFFKETHLRTIGLLNSGILEEYFFIWASFGSRINNQLFPEKLTIPNPCNIISYACVVCDNLFLSLPFSFLSSEVGLVDCCVISLLSHFLTCFNRFFTLSVLSCMPCPSFAPPHSLEISWTV